MYAIDRQTTGFFLRKRFFLPAVLFEQPFSACYVVPGSNRRCTEVADVTSATYILSRNARTVHPGRSACVPCCTAAETQARCVLCILGDTAITFYSIIVPACQRAIQPVLFACTPHIYMVGPAQQCPTAIRGLRPLRPAEKPGVTKTRSENLHFSCFSRGTNGPALDPLVVPLKRLCRFSAGWYVYCLYI